MNLASSAPIKWLSILASLLYLLLLWRIGDDVHQGISILFILSLATLDPQPNNGEPTSLQSTASGRLGQAVGIGLLAGFVAILGWVTWVVDPKKDIMTHRAAFIAARLAPLVAVTGLSLLAGGEQALRQFRRELVLAFFWSVPTVVITTWFDISPITAWAAEWNLRLAGYSAQREGLVVGLPGGSVRVYPGCSGIEAMGYLLGLSAVCLIAYPTSKRHWWWLPLTAVALGFWINSVRVAWLVILANRQDRPGFDYWHVGRGSLLFGMLAVAALGVLYIGLMLAQHRQPRATSHASQP